MSDDDYVIIDCKNCDANGMCHTAAPPKGILMDRPYPCPDCNRTKKIRVRKEDIPIRRDSGRKRR